MLLVTLGASFLGNILAGKVVIETSHGRGMNRAGERIVGAGYENEKGQKNKKKWIFNSPLSFN